MIAYNKNEIKKNLTLDNIFFLLNEWGGEPSKTSFGLVSSTICHNAPGLGSRKLYYYANSSLFQCYTDCAGYFDIFELTIKVFKIQYGKAITLREAILFIAERFGIAGEEFKVAVNQLDDWIEFENFDKIKEISTQDLNFTLKEYDSKVLLGFDYQMRLPEWENEGISRNSLAAARIGYYHAGDFITIPHFDIDGRFIGLRGRSLDEQHCLSFGKYHPLMINNTLYNHPLGMNLYGLNWSKRNIEIAKTAIVYEAEKSYLKHNTYFGENNNLSVACCGSSLSNYQIQLLKNCGVQEIILAFDRQFQRVGDEEYLRLVNHIQKIKAKCRQMGVGVSYILDVNRRTGYKDSPIDCGKEVFLELLKRRKTS